MRKRFVFLLCLLLLCSGFACKKNAAEPNGGAELLTREANANTVWRDGQGDALSFYGNGAAALCAGGETFRLSANGTAVSLQTFLYRQPADTTPACAISVGEIRLAEDGTAIRIEASSDPLGVLAHAKLNGLRLEKQAEAPDPAAGQDRWQAPLQPGSAWTYATTENGTEHVRLTLRLGNNCDLRGTAWLSDGTERSCSLMCNGSAVALLDETDASLLLYGCHTEQEEPGAARRALREWTVTPVYDPFGLCASGSLTLVRQGGPGMANTNALIGDSWASVEETLTEPDWTDLSDTLDNIDAALISSGLVWLTGEAQTLLIYCGWDYSSAEEERYIAAYVLYGDNSEVLEWSGFRPVDHTVAGRYSQETDTRFDFVCNAAGLDAGEVDSLFFLDDGTLALEAEFDEPYVGGTNFRIVNLVEVG